jgi:1,4-dihydroxy-2-naphthoate octaprenyltransferase
MTTKLIEYPNTKLWLAAIKPPMYSVAIMPIWLGTAVAFAETKTIHGEIFSTFNRRDFHPWLDESQQ